MDFTFIFALLLGMTYFYLFRRTDSQIKILTLILLGVSSITLGFFLIDVGIPGPVAFLPFLLVLHALSAFVIAWINFMLARKVLEKKDNDRTK